MTDQREDGVNIGVKEIYEDLQELKGIVIARLPDNLDKRLSMAETKIAVVQAANLDPRVTVVEQKVAVLVAAQGPRVHWITIVAGIAAVAAVLITVVPLIARP